MRTTHVMLVGLLFATSAAYTEDNHSIGLGIGALYSGIGVDIASRTEHDLRYLAAGCIALGYSDADGTITACGVGAGWLRSDILGESNNRHGLGLYLGPVGWRGNNYTGSEGNTIYGAGVTYVYFRDGIDNNGWNFGGTLAVGHKADANGYLLLQAGYQF